MAHSWRRTPQPLIAICSAVVALAATDARAIALGEAEVRSALGENLDVRIPVTIGKDESIEPSCFSLSRDPAPGIPRLAAARISIERSALGAQLRIRSSTPIDEPALMLGIAASCPGQASEYQRDYPLLLDPKPVPRAALTPMSIAATLIARIGDTLESIANAIFPRNRSAKQAYIAALRESNPRLATLDEREPIPIEARIALPDLRSFAKRRSESPTQIARAQPRAGPEARVRAQPRPAIAPKEREPARPRLALAPREERPAATRPPAPVTRGRPSPGYQLKLSSAEVDLSRSRTIDDRGRARLRDRQLVLDADDQVAAVLALRNSVRQLETKVAELQLKIAGMPSSFPAPKGEAAQPAGAPAAKTASPPLSASAPTSKVAPPAIAPPPPAASLPPPTVTPPPQPVTTPPTMVSAPTPAVKPPAAAVEISPPAALKTEPAQTPPAPPVATKPTAPPVAAKPAAAIDTKPATPPAAAKPAPDTAPRPGAADNEWLTYGLWALAVLLLAAAALLAWRLVRRRRSQYEEEETPGKEETSGEGETPGEGEIVVAEEPQRQEPVFAEAPIAPPRDMRPTVASDAELTTRIPGNTDDLRRRYIEERFPEIANGTIALDEPNSVVKAARLFYEDGAIARAIELLQFAIERKPAEVKSWLALFEIFRLERLSGEFAKLAQRFKEHHGKGKFWPKVQFFGREIDPGNKLYQDESFKSFETIGPAGARRMAEEASFDPIAENWLNAPMDFQNEVLANELRKALMAQASLNEQDLVANPMPALRNVEMFTVA